MKKSRRSPFSIFRRGKDDKNNNSSPTGKLFGKPLEDLVTEEGLPKAVMVSFIKDHTQCILNHPIFAK